MEHVSFAPVVALWTLEVLLMANLVTPEVENHCSPRIAVTNCELCLLYFLCFQVPNKLELRNTHKTNIMLFLPLCCEREEIVDVELELLELYASVSFLFY